MNLSRGYSWLGGDLRLPNRRSGAEAVQGANFPRSYYLQQLDWSMGVVSLWNAVEFRRMRDLEEQLDFAGLARRQMRPQLRHDAHLFERPCAGRPSGRTSTPSGWSSTSPIRPKEYSPGQRRDEPYYRT